MKIKTAHSFKLEFPHLFKNSSPVTVIDIGARNGPKELESNAQPKTIDELVKFCTLLQNGVTLKRKIARFFERRFGVIIEPYNWKKGHQVKDLT